MINDLSWDGRRKLVTQTAWWKKVKSDPQKHKEHNEKRKAISLRYRLKKKMKLQAIQAEQLPIDVSPCNMDEHV